MILIDWIPAGAPTAVDDIAPTIESLAKVPGSSLF